MTSFRSIAAAFAAIFLTASPAFAQNQSFDSYLAEVGQHARAQGVSQSTIDRVLRGLTPNPRVLELDL